MQQRKIKIMKREPLFLVVCLVRFRLFPEVFNLFSLRGLVLVLCVRPFEIIKSYIVIDSRSEFIFRAVFCPI